MAYNTHADPEYIVKFGKRMEKEWGRQAKHDKDFLDLYLRAEPQDTKKTLDKLKPLRIGMLGMATDRDAASLQGAIFQKVAPRGKRDGSPADKAAVYHANQILEPWFMGVMRQSQIGEVLAPQIRDLVLIDRGWSCLLPLPDMWAGDDFRKMVDEYASLAGRVAALVEDGDNEAKLKDLRAEMERVAEDISSYKADNFPLRWMYLPPTTWPQLSNERHLPEVVSVRKMKQGQLVEEFGKENLPEGLREAADSTNVTVYDYYNWAWAITVIPDASDSKVVREFEHDLGMNPCILMEANTLPDNPKGIRWKARAYDFKDALEALNEALTEMRIISRKQPTAPLVAKLDPNRTKGDVRAAGDPNVIEIAPDEDNTVHMLIGESLETGPTSDLADATIRQIEFLRDICLEVFLNPALRGDMKSGTSAVAYDAAKQAAQEIMSPYERAIERGLLHEMKLAARCVPRLNREYPDFPDEVVIIDEGYGAIKLGPKDVLGQEAYFMPKMKPQNPLTEAQQMALAIQAKELGTYGEADILTKFQSDENSYETLARRDISEIDKALLELLQQRVMQQAGVLMNAGQPRGDVSEEIAGMPATAQMALAANGRPEAQSLVASPGRQAANVVSTGTPQAMSNLEGIPG